MLSSILTAPPGAMPVCNDPKGVGDSPWSSGASLHSGPPGDTGGYLGVRSALDGTGGTPGLKSRRDLHRTDGAADCGETAKKVDEPVCDFKTGDDGLPSLDLNLTLGGERKYGRDVYVSRGRRLPTQADREARQNSPSGLPGSMCICEMCTCGGHACPRCNPGSKASLRAFASTSVPASPSPALDHPGAPKSSPRVRFEGVSSTHSDYVPPPLEALRDVLMPKRSQEDAENSMRQYARKFEGSSTTKDHFQPPTPADLLNACQPPGLPWTPSRTRFEGESTARRDFTAPQIELQRTPSLPSNAQPQAVRQQSALAPQGSRPRFEGESSTHRAFAPPPMASYRDAFQLTAKFGEGVPSAGRTPRDRVPFEGKSSSHRDYQPHSLEALQTTFSVPAADGSQESFQARDSVKFQGESSTHRDFPPPPLDSLREAHRYDHISASWAADTLGRRPAFDGQSSTHKDFLPPPQDALHAACRMPVHFLPDKNSPKFEGESTSRKDFPPPPLDSIRAAHRYDDVPADDHGKFERVKFEGESTTNRDFKPHKIENPAGHPEIAGGRARDALRSEDATARRVPFEGESLMHRSFTVPPLEYYRDAFRQPASDLPPVDRTPFQGESSTHRDFQPPSIEALRSSLETLETLLKVRDHKDDDVVKFEGESSSHRDFQAPPLDVIRAVHQSDTFHETDDVPRAKERALEIKDVLPEPRSKFEGESLMRGDFVPHPIASYREALQKPAAFHPTERVVFQGESSTHRDFQAPPLDALRATFDLPDSYPSGRDYKEKDGVKFDGESCSHRDFKAPPLDVVRGMHEYERISEEFQRSKFEGESSMRRDFTAHPAELYREALQRPEVPFTTHQLPFEGESSTHRDYQPHSIEALRATFDIAESYPSGRKYQDKEVVKFSGESSARSDYKAPPLDMLKAIHRYNLQSEEAGNKPREKKSFEGESSMRQAFTPPPAASYYTDAQPHMTSADSRGRERAAFEGESSTHRDFRPPPPLPAFQPEGNERHRQSKSREVSKFEGESSTHRDFSAPPPSAFRAAHQFAQDRRQKSRERIELSLSKDHRVFEGESSTSRDFRPPTLDALRAGFGLPTVVQRERQLKDKETLKFEGESSTHRDFKAPPLDVLRAVHRSERHVPVRVSRSFEGESSTHRAFSAPPPGAYRAAFLDLSERAGFTRRTHRAGGEGQARFEGESSTRRDFAPPPREALLAAFPASPQRSGRPSSALGLGADRAWEGESSMRRDYAPPSPEASKQAAASGSRGLHAHRDQPLPPSAAGTPSSGGRRPPRAASNGTNDRRSGLNDTCRFEGVSSSHHDFQSPGIRGSSTDLIAAGQGRERARSAPTRTSLGAAARTSLPARRFEGESSSRTAYTAPPPEAYARSANQTWQPSTPQRVAGDRDGRDFATTSQSHFQPPPPRSPCPAGHLCSVMPPPAPPAGREHVYYDKTARQWH